MSILSEAAALIGGDRQADYGDADTSFTRISVFWSAYLGHRIRPHDVAAMMTLLKLSRIAGDPTKRDSWTDAAGYIALGGQLTTKEEEA